MKKRKCKHWNTKILKSYRPNKKHSKGFTYDPPKRLTLVCTDCGKKIRRWKPKR